jgi:hypothetical protein
MRKTSITHRIIAASAVATLSLGVVACDDEDDDELEQDIDDGVDEVEEDVDDVGDEIEEEVED